MSNVYVERTHTGFFGNLGKSFKSVVTGMILFVLSFVVLWWNEGRTDLSRVAALSAVAAPDSVDASLDGRFLSVTGALKTEAQLEDPGLLLPVPAVILSRNVETYAWVEKSETHEEKNVGGSSDKVTTYRYQTEWTDHPQDSDRFHDPRAREKGYVNPAPVIESRSFRAEAAQVGAYPFRPEDASLPSTMPLEITPEMIPGAELSAEQSEAARQAQSLGARFAGGALYIGAGSMSSPVVGDARIHYTYLPAGGTVTIFGKLSAGKLEAYVHTTGDRLLRVLKGGREEAIAELAFEHKAAAWILRVVGFLMMWIGLGSFLSPLHAVLDVLPFLGGLSRSMVSIAMFPVALVLSGVTIVVSKIAHSPVALVIVLVLLVGGFFVLVRKKK